MIADSYGCGSDRVDGIVWPESDIGHTVQLPCPCEDVLLSGNNASRTCRQGTHPHRGQWSGVDYTQCDTVVKEITNALCSIAMVKQS